MKKNFIYSLCILLCGAVFMSSCEDMLEVDSDRVEYDMSPLTLNDTVYSVLGILKNIQAVADRQVLLGELRGDLMVVNEGSATTEIQKIARFEFDGENKYLSAKDYYAIINNCNIYLARVDTTLTHNNVKLMLREYVAVKSVRAWTYLQLVTNYGKVPFFTEPILTHSLSQEIASRPLYGIEEVADALIEDLRPFADPVQYPMPMFPEVAGYNFATSLYFMPIRQLLGDLYLWKKDYRNAIDCYYNLIIDNKYTMNGLSNYAQWGSDEIPSGSTPGGDYKPLLSFGKTNTLALIAFASSTEVGSVSELPSIISGNGVIGSHQVAAAPGLTGLSKRQTYYFVKGGDSKATKATITLNPSKEKPGDTRVYKYVEDNVNNTTTGVSYNGIITKYNQLGYILSSSTLSALKLGRPVQAYLRLAEALAGLAAEESTGIITGGENQEYSSWENAAEVAMYILRFGLGTKTYNVGKGQIHQGLALPADLTSGKYTIKKRLTDESYTEQVVKTDPVTGEIVYKTTTNPETGEEEPVYVIDPETGEPMLDSATGEPIREPEYVEETRYKATYDYITLDFTNDAFKGNMGIHGFGAGISEWDESLSFDNDSIIAAYLGLASADNPTIVYDVDPETGENKLDNEGNPIILGYDYGITRADEIKYLYNILLDECALETALEGYRFTDLVRFAEAMGDNDILAKRVAARAYENKVNMYYDNTKEVYGNDGIRLEFKWDEALREKLANDKSTWFLPLK